MLVQVRARRIFLSFCCSCCCSAVVIYRSREMAVNICMCFVFVSFLTHEIICRTIDSKTVPTVINALNQSKTMLENNTPNTTAESTTSNTPTASTVDSNSLEICEYFDETIGQPNFRFHEHGATVIMPLL